jgi:hypothetical protein
MAPFRSPNIAKKERVAKPWRNALLVGTFERHASPMQDYELFSKPPA